MLTELSGTSRGRVRRGCRLRLDMLQMGSYLTVSLLSLFLALSPFAPLSYFNKSSPEPLTPAHQSSVQAICIMAAQRQHPSDAEQLADLEVPPNDFHTCRAFKFRAQKPETRRNYTTR